MAFGAFDQSGDQPLAEINMIPLVDVMLVLLVVFIITAPIVTHAVKVELPNASSSPAEPDEPTIVVAIEAGGDLLWDGEPVTMAQLHTRLERLSGPRSELPLQADRAAVYETIVRVMAAARRAGVERIGFVTTPEAAHE